MYITIVRGIILLKTFAQQTLETAKGKDIVEIVRDALEAHRGQDNLVTFAAANLGTSEPTLRSWCRKLYINISDYRQPAAEPASV